LKHALISHSWPGNIRELENVMRRIAVFGNPDATAKDLLADCGQAGGVEPEIAAPAPLLRESVFAVAAGADRLEEESAIIAALNYTHWNRRKAAVLLNMDYKALIYRIKKYGIDSRRGPF
jgi:DNA-binding NtrC family response regulator